MFIVIDLNFFIVPLIVYVIMHVFLKLQSELTSVVVLANYALALPPD